MTEYTISLKYTPEITPGDNGNFEVLKEYKVSKKTSAKTPGKGIVIQCVQKNSVVFDASEAKYDTTDSIRNLTSGAVQYSNDSYFEIFYLDKNGESKYGDSFANNSLIKYDEELQPFTYQVGDVEYEIFKTKGEINITGTNCFISETNPNYSTIVSLAWNNNKMSPANGLPFLPFSRENYNLIFTSSDSNILIHKVNVKWSFEDPTSIVMSSVIENSPFQHLGGKKRKRRYTRKYKKKRNKRTSYKH
jgi:hypothetical protein